MAEPRSAEALPLAPLVALVAAATLTVAPHALWLPWWVDATAAVLLVWRAALALRSRALPARWLLLLLTLASATGVFFSYRTIMGRDPGVTLLVLLLFLKLMETRERRDVFVVAFLVYFVALSNFFYSQSIPTAALMLLTVFITTATLVGFSAPQRPVMDDAKTAGRMLLQAGPVMLLLFFLFPRVQGPLWGMPQDAYTGTTGLSETMSPGSISGLSLSDSIAFRVKFEGQTPPRGQLYWRGPVLSDFDGTTWRVGLPQLRRDMRIGVDGAPVDYEVTLEPHNRNWMFALEMPTVLPPGARVTSDYQVISLTPILGSNSVDEFLFNTRQGFCEHFASSFVFLMRAAGVPARVVTGYQGGDTNPVDGYMVVRQADAHAWAEVWLAENGWTRVDPTAAAVPVRIELGITAARPRGAALPLLMRAGSDWLKALRNNWEAVTNQWNQWVLGYNPDRQREMLTWLGVQQPSWQTMTVMLFWSVAGVLLLVALALLRGIRREDAVQSAWLRFCDKLSSAGLARALPEGPLDYCDRVAGRLPAREAAVRAIAALYVDLRYGPRADTHSVARMKQLVREFRP